MKTTDMMIDNGLVNDNPIANIGTIVTVATQGFELKDDDDPTPFIDAVKPLDSAGQMLVLVAMRMMRHKDIAIATANQVTTERLKKLAEHFGGSVKEGHKPAPGTEGMTTLIVFPPPSTELKLLLENVKNIATRSFLQEGEMVSRFVLEFDGGDRLSVPCPWSDDEQKLQRLGSLKRTIREHGRLKRYAHVSEVWASKDKDVRPARSKNRTEHLLIRAEERFSLPIGGWFDIKRHALSPMPTLGSWEDVSGEISNSSMFDLFDDDQSSDGARERPTSKTTKPVMPSFVFQRRSHVEQEAGFILAGQLIVDLPKDTEMDDRRRGMIQNIISQLVDEARSGFLPADAVICGWRGGVRPENAADTDDDALMSAWADRSLKIALRVDPRNDGLMRTDSDALAEMGLLKHDA